MVEQSPASATTTHCAAGATFVVETALLATGREVTRIGNDNPSNTK
jgi:hypothetical protein